jgi:hypothetical protein
LLPLYPARAHFGLCLVWRGFSEKTAKFLLEMQARFAPRRVQDHEIPKEFFTRMKRSLALIAILASGFALSAVAQTMPTAAAPAGPAKTAVIAFQAAVGQTNEFQRDFADLQKKYDPKRAQLKALGDEIETLDKQLQTQGDKLSEPRTPRTASSRSCRSFSAGWQPRSRTCSPNTQRSRDLRW